MTRKRKIQKIVPLTLALCATLVLFQNCNGGYDTASTNTSTGTGSSTGNPPDGGDGGGGGNNNPPACPRTSNARPSVTGFSTNSIDFAVGMGRDAGTDGPKEVRVNFTSGDNYSAVVDIECDVPRNSGITANCNAPNPTQNGSIDIAINADNDAECASGSVSIRVTVEDAVVGANNAPITACNNLAQTSTANSFTVNVQNRCLPTQRVNPDVPYEAGQMGRSVAIDGDWAVAVAPRDETKASDAGAAFVMRRNGNSWSIVQKLIPSTLAAGNQLFSAAIGDGVIALGSPFVSSGNGAVWLFQYNGSQWLEVKTILPPTGGGGLFGSSLAVSNGSVAVGASQANLGGGVYSGAAYVYSGSGWNSVEVFEPSGNATARGEFGTSVALSGSTLIVGAPFPTGSTPRQEAVYVFNGGSLQRKILNPRNASAADRFGTSVSLDGNNLLVGAPYTSNRRGIAYLFQRSGGAFAASPVRNYVLADPNEDDVDLFGQSVAISGSRVLIAAPDKVEASGKAGAVYLFGTSNNNQIFKIRSRADDRDDDSFGFSIAVNSAGWLLAGALNDEHSQDANNSGSVYFVDLP